MKTTLKILAFLFAVCAASHAQVAPAATGPRGGLPVGPNFHYAFRYSQTAQFGGNTGNWQTSSPSASVEYTNGNERRPFALDYGGGYTWTLTGPTYETGLFQHLYLSQDFVWRKWRVQARDDVSYLPQSPITGFSGIPGTGEPIGVPNPNPTPSISQTILTLNTHVVDNIASGEIEHNLNFATSLTGGGSSELMRYPNGDGLNTNTQTGRARLQWRLNGRNSIRASYVISDYSYPDFFNIDFVTNTALVGFQHQWSRSLTTIASVGPEWVSSSDQGAVPSSTNVSVSAAINYQLRFTTANISYARATNGGSGSFVGGEVDAVQGNFSRQFGLNSTIGLTGGFARTEGLNNNGVTNSKFGGAQFTRQIGRSLIVFANYTGIDQTSTSNLPTNALGQLLQVVGFGVGYSPRETHIRQ
jgi:hypothetical protein